MPTTHSFLTHFRANLETKFKSGFTPIYVASLKGHVDVVRLLMKHGANIHSSCDDGSTPLFVAAQNGHLDTVKARIK